MTLRNEILVVGAGPVGLATALELSRLGVGVRVIDQAELPTTQSRATGVLPATLLLLEPTGATEQMIAAGVRLAGVHVVAGDRTRATIETSRLRHRYPFMLSLPQDRTEAILAKILADRGVSVERGVSVSSIETHADRAEVTLLLNGREERATASWLVGADGAHSNVRKSLSIGFPGDAYPHEWSLLDAEIDGAEQNYGEIVLDRHAPLMLRLPLGGTRHRVIANGSDVVAVAAERWRLGRVHWQSKYRVSHRRAEQLGSGRVWLVGDAAHVHSPAGGRGMNLGIEDGITLARRIVEGKLGDWAAERQAKAAAVIKESDRMQRLATADGSFIRWLLPRTLGAVTTIPALHDRLVQKLAVPW